jgi:hypothetical protein
MPTGSFYGGNPFWKVYAHKHIYPMEQISRWGYCSTIRGDCKAPSVRKVRNDHPLEILYMVIDAWPHKRLSSGS